MNDESYKKVRTPWWRKVMAHGDAGGLSKDLPGFLA